jgi:hypothetical protein
MEHPMLKGKKINLHRKKDGTTYVYEVLERRWVPELKSSRTQQVCIGKLDKETGAFIPSKRLAEQGADAALDKTMTARSIVTGTRLLLEKIGQDIGLSATLKKVAPDGWKEILSLAWYLLSTHGALSNAELWLANHEVPTDKHLSSQRISDLLQAMDEDMRQSFFKAWKKGFPSKEHLCYDITSISSYATGNEYVRYGYNRDDERLPQINVAVVYGQTSMLPMIYRELPGSISDVTTLKNTLHHFDKLEYGKLHLVMDRGLYSKKNIDALCDARQHFTIGVPSHLRRVRDLIDRHRDDIDGFKGYRILDGEATYSQSFLQSWGEQRRRCYLHIYFNGEQQQEDRVRFDQFITDRYLELTEGSVLDEYAEIYERFFIIKDTPKRGRKVLLNEEALNKARNKYVGFSAILSTKFKDALEALAVYREKDIVEKCFDDLKNELDMRRLRVHGSKRMKSRLFIQFLAMILLAAIRKRMRETELANKYSVTQLLWELESLTTIYYSGRYKNKLSEVTKAQREIFEAFNVDIPN